METHYLFVPILKFSSIYELDLIVHKISKSCYLNMNRHEQPMFRKTIWREAAEAKGVETFMDTVSPAPLVFQVLLSSSPCPQQTHASNT